MFRIKTFKDGQLNAEITQKGNICVDLRGNTYEDLFKAATIKEAWDAVHRMESSYKTELKLYCLNSQRSDRRFSSNSSFDLKVVADFINAMKYDKVHIFHPHSDVSLALIHNSVAISYFEFVEKTCQMANPDVLVSPDAGAYKANFAIAEQLQIDLVAANKVRLSTGPKIVFQGDVKNKSCLIVDDLADGGRTFKYLADALKEHGAQKVDLYVSHGMFSHGFDELKKSIDHFYCTNSYRDINKDFVTQFDIYNSQD